MKKASLLIVLIFPLISVGQANKFYRQAMRALDLNEKINLLTKVIELEPKNLDAYFHRAIAKNDLGDYHSAILDYSKIIISNPDADTYYNRGNSKYSLKNFVGAKYDYAKAFELDVNFIDALYSLACVKHDLEDFEGAIKDFSKVIETVPDQSKTYLLRAASYIALKDYKNALKDYALAILIEPSADNYYNRGAFFLDIKYFKKANTDLNTSLRLHNKNAFALFYRGASNLFLGKFNKAIVDFTSALKFDDADFDAYIGLAFSFYKINDITNAKLNLQKAKTILSQNNNSASIDLFENTYWYQSHYYYFVNNIKALSKL